MGFAYEALAETSENCPINLQLLIRFKILKGKSHDTRSLGQTTVWQRFGSSFSYETAGDTGRFALVTKYVEAQG